MPQHSGSPTFLDTTCEDDMRNPTLGNLGNRRPNSAREGLREGWINKKPPTLNDHPIIAKEVAHGYTKGSALNIPLYILSGSSSQHEHSLLSRGKGELSNKEPLIKIRYLGV
jgi:hypothetical protein